MESGIKRYTKGTLTVLWQPEKCIHSGHCVRGLPAVFNGKKQPWITLAGGSATEIIAQVKACPSHALAIEQPVDDEGPATSTAAVRADGPLLVTGRLTLTKADGTTVQHEGTTAFCRCGASANKPFCDGSHQRIGFKG